MELEKGVGRGRGGGGLNDISCQKLYRKVSRGEIDPLTFNMLEISLLKAVPLCRAHAHLRKPSGKNI